MDVSVIPDRAAIATDKEYRIEKFHCGGKGGQNVNKVETGVRIIHLPTGLAAQSTEERSQFRNKQRAMEKLQEKLAGLQREQDEKQVYDAWREHNRIVRGNPVRIYEGEKFVLKKHRIQYNAACANQGLLTIRSNNGTIENEKAIRRGNNAKALHR